MRNVLAGVMIVAVSLTVAGCSAPQYAKVRSVPRSPLADKLQLTSWRGPKPSDRSIQLLRQYDLATKVERDLPGVIASFHEVLESEPSPDKHYTMSELCFLAGKKVDSKDEKQALDYYGSAVKHAYLYLFDPQFVDRRNPYDPQFRGACDLYNGALENALRLIIKHNALVPGTTINLETASRKCDIAVVLEGRHWRPEDFDRFEFVSDFDVQGLTNQFQTFGLGVPLIAVRRRPDPDAPTEKFYPPELRFPVTAFMRVMPASAEGMLGLSTQALLELHDPLESTDIPVAQFRVPLESDLSTPLACFLNDPTLNQLATYGLLRPDQSEKLTGIYMLQPYEPGKIPVIFVHGLWSSPLTWVEMFNDLRSHPEIRSRYQFWFYLYPTGQPFWISATRMRADLAEMRVLLDPHRDESALDEMVLVGHSMGGLVSKCQTVYSGDQFWKIVSDEPFENVKGTPEQLDALRRLFFFEPNPSVRRVITIGTPHRGSAFANGTTQWLSHKLIYLPTMLTIGRQEIVKENPGLFRDDDMLNVKTSIDSLSPNSPILPVLLMANSPPTVKYHTIIGVIPNEGILGRVAGGSDGVVTYESARLDQAASELIVNADHNTVHRHPLAVLEVRRILLEHLQEVRAPTPSALPKVYPASGISDSSSAAAVHAAQ